MSGRWIRAAAFLWICVPIQACDSSAPADDDDDFIVEDDDDDDDDDSSSGGCPAGTVQEPDLPEEFIHAFPDGCVPDSCGMGTWGDLPVGTEMVFVDARAAEDGDGSQTAPLQSIQGGVDLAGELDREQVVVAAGIYEETVTFNFNNDGVRLAGRCRELVVLDASAADEGDAGIHGDGRADGAQQWWVEGLTVTGAPYAGVFGESGQLHVQDAVLEANRGAGVFAFGSHTTVVLIGVRVLNSEPWADGRFGRGVHAEDRARIELEDVEVSGNMELGIGCFDDGTECRLTDVHVAHTRVNSDGEHGTGVSVQSGGWLEAEGCLIESNTNAGVYLSMSATASLTDVEVRGTVPLDNGELGIGIIVQDGSALSAVDCRVEDNTSEGIYVNYSSTATLTRVDVVGTRPDATGKLGRGIAAAGGSSLQVQDCQIEDNSDVGVVVSGAGTQAELSDVEVLRTQQTADGWDGRGIVIQEGARLVAEGVLVEGSHTAGISASSECTVALTDVEVRDTQLCAVYSVAPAVLAQRTSTLTATRLDVSGTAGPGLYATHLASLSCTDCTVNDSTFAAAVAVGGASMTIRDSAMSEVDASASLGGGAGIFVARAEGLGHSTLDVENSRVEGVPLASVWLDGEGVYSLRDCELEGGSGYDVEYPDGSTRVVAGDGVVAVDGITAWDGAQGLLLEDNEIHGALRAGILLHGSSAWLDANTFDGNDVDLIRQECEGVDPPHGLDDIPTADLCPAYNHALVPMTFLLEMEEPDPLE